MNSGLNVTYLLAMGFTKASICSTLLRINNGTGQRQITQAIWLMIFSVVMATTIGLSTFLIRCDRDGGCKDSSTAISTLYWLVVSVYILVDIALAVIPVFIIHGLNMKRSLKLSTGAILAMGGIACLAAILRIPAQLEDPANTGASDRLYKMGSFILWGEIETGLGIIACCLPMMHKLLRSFDNDPALDTLRRPAHYQPRHSEHSRRTPVNDTRRQAYDPSNGPEREKATTTLCSFDTELEHLPLEHIYSAKSYLTTDTGAQVQHELPVRRSSSLGIVKT